MDTYPVLHSLRNASTLLRNADTELLRPEEDSVLLCACHSTKNAMMVYLKSYLAGNKIDNNTDSLEQLLSECSKLNPQFNDIEINCFDCKSDESNAHYCLDANKISECYTQAKSVEELVFSGLKISMEDL